MLWASCIVLWLANANGMLACLSVCLSVCHCAALCVCMRLCMREKDCASECAFAMSLHRLCASVVIEMYTLVLSPNVCVRENETWLRPTNWIDSGDRFSINCDINTDMDYISSQIFVLFLAVLQICCCGCCLLRVFFSSKHTRTYMNNFHRFDINHRWINMLKIWLYSSKAIVAFDFFSLFVFGKIKWKKTVFSLWNTRALQQPLEHTVRHNSFIAIAYKVARHVHVNVLFHRKYE